MYNSAKMECEKKEYQLQAVCFAASTAVFIACFERAVVRSFMEQWRVLMFLALNLLLLAILFTSTSPALSPQGLQNSNGDEDLKAERKKRMKQCSPLVYTDNGDGGERLELLKSRIKTDEEAKITKVNRSEHRRVKAEDVENQKNVETNVKQRDRGAEADVKEQAYQLSKEELNERVEAFIAMFRQHLISDAKGRSCRRLHSSSNSVPVCPCRGVTNYFKE